MSGRTKEDEPVIANFLSMLEKGTDNALLRYSLGNAYFAEQQYPEAVEHLDEAVKQDPGYSAAWKLLGRCHLELKQFSRAVVVYDQGIAVAEEKGDKQAAKEMQVFRRRAAKAADS
jgi:tetratricopeptide (TPR) repeat protein